MKRCGNNNKDEDNSLKTLNDKNQQASSQKFRQLGGILFQFQIIHSLVSYSGDPFLRCSQHLLIPANKSVLVQKNDKNKMKDKSKINIWQCFIVE